MVGLGSLQAGKVPVLHVEPTAEKSLPLLPFHLACPAFMGNEDVAGESAAFVIFFP